MAGVGTLPLHLPGARSEGLAPSENLFVQRGEKVISVKKLTLIDIGSGRKLAGESVFTKERWMLWPLKGPGAVSHHSLHVWG